MENPSICGFLIYDVLVMMRALVFFVVLAVLSVATAFRPAAPRHAMRPSTALQMGLGDMLKKAMANENMGPPVNPGLSREPEALEVEFLPSGKKVKAYGGQKVSMVAQSAGVTIKYSCKKGDCGTCMINFNGKQVKACQSSFPPTGSVKKFVITTTK